ncbi:MAG: gamma carbonic anhydrase family protein [Candidatus Kapabacteria bacterium]|nr:gamma carbonic anhydrase family protein [Candidatus Kapabacteria bacterium]
MILETGNNGKIITYKGITPKIHESVFLCDGVKIIGDVEIGKDSSVWYNCVIRGDVNYIRIGERTNIQDLSMFHVQNGTHPLIIGNDVSIAHSVTLHGCILNDKCLVGIGAIILNGAMVSSNSIVAAGALVKENFNVPSGVLVAGVPAKIIRDLKPEEIEMIERTAKNYVHYVEEYRNQIK